MLEIAGLREKVSAINQDLNDMKRLFLTISRGVLDFKSGLYTARDILFKDFEAYAGVEASKAELLIPTGLATNTKKAVKRWPDPIKQNASKATSTGRRPAKPAAH